MTQAASTHPPTPTVDFDELEFAMEGNSSASSLGMENISYVMRATGQVCHYFSELEGTCDPDPEALEIDAYVIVPTTRDLDLGTPLVFQYAREHIPELREAVLNIFRKRGAFARYKDFLGRIGKLDHWYAFRDAETEKALREWCAKNNLTVSERKYRG